VVEDRSGDGVPVGSFNAVAGSFQRQQPRPRDLFGQRLAVGEREHRVGGAVDDERGTAIEDIASDGTSPFGIMVWFWEAAISRATFAFSSRSLTSD
jgi:hypothetical protein